MRAREAENRLELSVRDEGPGFPEEFTPRAFDRFTRADPAHAGSGAGLGLAIVDVIARAHGGSASVRKRTEVAIDLPVKIAACPRPAASS